MARRYRVTFSNVLVAAAQDLVQIVAPASTKMFRIIRHWLGCTNTSIPTSQMLYIRGKVFTATVSNGSGGTTGITPTKNDQGDSTCSSTTCATNNTTPATTTGATSIVYSNGCHAYQGDNWRYDEPIPINSTEAFIFELLSTVSGTVNMSGGVEFEEIGG